jgi:gliding motility-associated-like protein
VFVEVLQDIFVPNSFTPGTDGVNDTFKPVVRLVKEGSFMIFNRWGEKIFSTNNLDQGWDGTYLGKPVKVDVYVYQVDVLFYNGVEKTLRGNVTLLR